MAQAVHARISDFFKDGPEASGFAKEKSTCATVKNAGGYRDSYGILIHGLLGFMGGCLTTAHVIHIGPNRPHKRRRQAAAETKIILSGILVFAWTVGPLMLMVQISFELHSVLWIVGPLI